LSAAANPDVAARVQAVAEQAGLHEDETIIFRTVKVIVDQAREGAHQRQAERLDSEMGDPQRGR
jgi:hypothetical protein